MVESNAIWSMNAASQQLSVPKRCTHAIHPSNPMQSGALMWHESCKQANVSAKKMHTCYPSFKPNAAKVEVL